MKVATLPVREAYFSRINNTPFMGQLIPAFDEDVTDQSKVATLTINQTPVTAYIRILNQTSGNNSAKCQRSDQVSTQIQVVTKYPRLKGGYKVAEQIASAVLALLFPDTGEMIQAAEPFHIYKHNLESARNIKYLDDNTAAWTHQMILVTYVSQSNS